MQHQHGLGIATPASRHPGFSSGWYERHMDDDGDDRETPSPLAFATTSDALAMDIVDLFSPPLERDALFTDVDTSAVAAHAHKPSTVAGAHSHDPSSVDLAAAFDFGLDRVASAAFSAVSSPLPSSMSSSVAVTPGTAGHTSSGTESEPTAEPEPPSRSSAAVSKTMAAAEDPAEVRRKRNRESMRRVRLRKRDAKLTTQQTVDELEAKLQQLMEQNARAATQLQLAAQSHSAARVSLPLPLPGTATAASPDVDAAEEPTYAQLLSETAALSFANKSLRDRVQTYQVLEASLARMLDDEQLSPSHSQYNQQQQHVLTPDEARSADAEILKPLLSWLTPAALLELTALATQKIEANRALIESLVPNVHGALGWSDQRVVHSDMARYLLRKTFRHESIDALASKTWRAIVDIEQLSKVMRWAKGMRVLQWLSDDAAVVTRELTIPSATSSGDGGDGTTQFRFTLLVYRSRTPAGGYVMGTINLNIYGTTVDECLAKDTTYKGGVHAHTMYGWTFTPTTPAGGCAVELAGLTGNGTLAYAHNVLMEMITVVLLWENALVAQIKLLRT